MRSVPKLLGGVLAFTICAPKVVHAIDLVPSELPTIQNTAVDGSVVANSLGGGSVDFNATFAPFGDINESGFRLRGSGNASWYKFITGEDPRTVGTGHSIEGGLLAGYQISVPRLSIVGLVGGVLGESWDQGVRSTRWGAKAAASMYATPWDNTMAFSSVSYSTVANFLQLQSKAGVRLIGNFYIGPEVNLSWRNVVPSSNNIATARLGGHVSAIDFGLVQAGISAGLAHDRELGWGYYGGASFYRTF
jgi:hypothetical protein